jgi:hypothetical protein
MKVVNLRVPEDIHKAIKELAEKDRRSLNAEIVYILEQYAKQKQEKMENQG